MDNPNKELQLRDSLGPLLVVQGLQQPVWLVLRVEAKGGGLRQERGNDVEEGG